MRSHSQGKLAEAAALSQPTLASQQRVLGPAHPETLRTASPVCSTSWTGTPRPSPFCRSTPAGWRHALGPGHKDTLNMAHSLAKPLDIQGRYAEVAVLRAELLADRQ